MDLSLDEIIKQKGIWTIPKKKFPVTKRLGTVRTAKIQNPKLVDARIKIIQNNRLKIRDAREKLSQATTKPIGDARLRLIKKQKLSSSNSNVRTKRFNTTRPKLQRPPPRKISVVGVPRGYVDYDNMEIEEAHYEPISIALRRTVHNEMAPPFGYAVPDRPSGHMWGKDPFECYDPPVSRPSDMVEPQNIRRDIRNMSPELMPRKGILRSTRTVSPPIYQRRFIPDNTSHLSYEMRSRLEHAPDPHASSGIFANPLKKQSPPPRSLSQHQLSSGFRIVVSNLHSSVTQSDIKELFEDIGALLEARLVRPGVAEVIFKSLKDAEKAVDTYHNRQLDGQPMKCLLVNPRASNKPTAPALKTSNAFSSKSSSKTALEIDIDALHKVLFRRN